MFKIGQQVYRVWLGDKSKLGYSPLPCYIHGINFISVGSEVNPKIYYFVTDHNEIHLHRLQKIQCDYLCTDPKELFRTFEEAVEYCKILNQKKYKPYYA